MITRQAHPFTGNLRSYRRWAILQGTPHCHALLACSHLSPCHSKSIQSAKLHTMSGIKTFASPEEHQKYSNKSFFLRNSFVNLSKKCNLLSRSIHEFSKESYSGKRVLQKYSPNWDEQSLSVFCCPDLYHPQPDGIKMEVSYVDSGHDLPQPEKRAIATVVLVHGAGRTHKSMLPLAQSLVDKGFRVVLPNFPGMGLTKSQSYMENKMYGHTVEENMDFLGNFLHFLGIGKIDLMVGHSASCYTLASLVSFLQHIDGYVYICPGTGPDPPRGIRPFWFFKGLSWMWENPVLWPITAVILKLSSLVFKKRLVPNFKAAAITLQTMVGARFYLTPKLAIMMREFNVPLLFCCTTRDPVVYEKEYMEYAELNGVSSFDVYDKELKLIEKGNDTFTDRYCHGVKFDIASHLPFENQTQIDIIVDNIMKMFNFNQQKVIDKLKS